MPHKFEKRCEARQSKIREGSVLEHVTKRIAVITPHRALVVLRFLLNNPRKTLRFRLKRTTCCHPNSYNRSAGTGEMFGLMVVAALMVDAVALAAISARISEFGYSPSKVAALDERRMVTGPRVSLSKTSRFSGIM